MALLVSRLVHLSHSVPVAPTEVSAPVLSGTTQVGYPLTTTKGVFNNAYFYDVEWYTNTVNSTTGGTRLASDSQDLSILLDDPQNGLYIFTGVTAIGAAGLRLGPIYSNILGPVAAGSGLSTPTLTRTSPAGAAVAWITSVGTDIDAGYYYHIKQSADGIKNADGSYTNVVQDIVYTMLDSDFAAGITTTGTTANGSNQITGIANTSGIVVGLGISGPGILAGTTVAAIVGSTVTMSANASTGAGTGTITFSGVTVTHAELAAAPYYFYNANGPVYIQGRWEREDGATSPAWSNDINATVTAPVARWSNNPNAPVFGINAGVSLDSSGLTFTGSANNTVQGVKTTVCVLGDVVHIELTVVALQTGGQLRIGICDDSQSMIPNGVSPGASSVKGVCAQMTQGASSATIHYNGTTLSMPLPAVPAPGDVMALEYKISTGAWQFAFKSLSAGTTTGWQTGTALNSTYKTGATTTKGFGAPYKADSGTLNADGVNTVFAIPVNMPGAAGF